MAGPLEGIKIIDASAVVSGPLATMMLADQGAEVIKLEPPSVGDVLRLSPFSRGGLTSFQLQPEHARSRRRSGEL